ncbi:MAG: hypothetical protein FWH27_01050 [Planctomycetaceae bacterium]|nr:hypothetical protein [Planctomycetaceae bacterium]
MNEYEAILSHLMNYIPFNGEAAYREACSRNDLFEDRLEALSLFTLPD